MRRKEGVPVQLLINSIRLMDKNKLGARTCFRLKNEQFLWNMENHHKDPVAHHHLKIGPGYMTIVNKYEDWVMLCPDWHSGIITIDLTPTPSTTP